MKINDRYFGWVLKNHHNGQSSNCPLNHLCLFQSWSKENFTSDMMLIYKQFINENGKLHIPLVNTFHHEAMEFYRLPKEVVKNIQAQIGDEVETHLYTMGEFTLHAWKVDAVYDRRPQSIKNPFWKDIQNYVPEKTIWLEISDCYVVFKEHNHDELRFKQKTEQWVESNRFQTIFKRPFPSKICKKSRWSDTQREFTPAYFRSEFILSEVVYPQVWDYLNEKTKYYLTSLHLKYREHLDSENSKVGREMAKLMQKAILNELTIRYLDPYISISNQIMSHEHDFLDRNISHIEKYLEEKSIENFFKLLLDIKMNVFSLRERLRKLPSDSQMIRVEEELTILEHQQTSILASSLKNELLEVSSVLDHLQKNTVNFFHLPIITEIMQKLLLGTSSENIMMKLVTRVEKIELTDRSLELLLSKVREVSHPRIAIKKPIKKVA